MEVRFDTKYDQKVRGISPFAVFDDLPWYRIRDDFNPTVKTKEQANHIFDKLILPFLDIRGRKTHQKREFFCRLFQASKVAIHHRGCVAFSRDSNRSGVFIEKQVIDLAVEKRILIEYRRQQGRTGRMSRYLPTSAVKIMTEKNPWDFDPENPCRLISIRDRKDKKELPVDLSHPTAKFYSKRLKRINETNNEFIINYRPFLSWEGKLSRERKQLKPYLFAVFCDGFDLHGRLYCGGNYGHIGLMREERNTIRFDGEPSIELDYSGLHARMIYHLEGIDFRGDPYALWGKETTGDQRTLAKVFINALINAKNPAAAISACNFAMCSFTKAEDDEGDPIRKTGKAYRDAIELYGAWKRSKVKFSELLPLVLKKHDRIAHRFGCDMGIKLMRTDSEIALNVLHHFARKSIPALSCHDSFIVPESYERELVTVMREKYEKKLSFPPIIR